MWRADGWDVKWRVGVLVPHADVCPESELRAAAPPEVGIHAARAPFGAIRAGGKMDATIPLAPVRAFAEPPGVDDAVGLLAAAPVQAIGFGFTSSAYVIGAAGEEAMLVRLSERAGGLPVVSPCAAAAVALRGFGSERVAVISPPWFDSELTELGAGYYRAAGFDVVFSAPADLPSDQHMIKPADLYTWVVHNVPDHADAVTIGGNGFRAIGVIEALETELGRPVLTANQVLLWALMSAAGAEPKTVTGYGRVFELPHPG
ncbi:MAG TPA: maleate cis-trans isomerase [Pseudonocardia sp.]|jgi:maleate isomerase|uniref:maleate cis-trans isomerase family protein n=1 Tax=Pseudonocardia sp. TaxID=60912 RepID=UPI002CFC4A91|nr:maleate cis-trans isomerase [Pseudonocardia sp.]HTF55226.1 maleate cis-trans isomerase [Pseudonocardia sp.]